MKEGNMKGMGCRSAIGALTLTAMMLPFGEGRAQEPGLQQYLGGWPEGAPAQLRANESGPYWSRRTRDQVLMEGIVNGQRRMMSQVPAPSGHPPNSYRPQLLRGRCAPELFYRRSSSLVAQNGPRLATSLGKAEWEYYAAARTGPNLFAAAFGIRRDGFSKVALIYDPSAPVIVAQMREPRHGVWAPVALVSDTRAFVVYRGFLIFPGRGHGIIIEAMDVSALRAQKKWNPIRRQWSPGASGYFYGDPAADIDDRGLPHFVATIWNPRDQPTGRIVVNGNEIAYAGRASYWLPQIAYVRGRGLVISTVGPAGTVQIGQVRGPQYTLLAELPGRDALLAAHGTTFYASTSDGLWSFPAAGRPEASAESNSMDEGLEDLMADQKAAPTQIGPQVPAWPMSTTVPLFLLGLLALGCRQLRSRRTRLN